MSLHEALQSLAQELKARVQEKGGMYELTLVVAERKAFLSTQKLEYVARFRIDEARKTLSFSEMLRESGKGLPSESGFGFQKETYKIQKGERSGTIEEQSLLFGKKYQYQLEYSTIRKRFEEMAQQAGYQFQYQILPLR